eukprot:gene8511-9383_t
MMAGLSALCILLCALCFWQTAESFSLSALSSRRCHRLALPRSRPSRSLQMIDFDFSNVNAQSGIGYYGIFFATMLPSMLIIKFVGDRADASRTKMSSESKERFKKELLSSSADENKLTKEEEGIKKQLEKAIMQGKDVEAAVLEEKLRQRVKWRKEVAAQRSAAIAGSGKDDKNAVDEDGCVKLSFVCAFPMFLHVVVLKKGNCKKLNLLELSSSLISLRAAVLQPAVAATRLPLSLLLRSTSIVDRDGQCCKGFTKASQLELHNGKNLNRPLVL